MQRFYYFVAMDQDTQFSIKKFLPDLKPDRHPLLLDFTSDYAGVSVPDPYSGNEADFENAMAFIQHGVHGVVKYFLEILKSNAA